MIAAKTDESLGITTEIGQLSLVDLRTKWAGHWGQKPHARLGRRMLEASLAYKIREEENGGLSQADQKFLQQLIKDYKRAPQQLGNGSKTLKPGTQLVRTWDGKDHTVIVQSNGFEFDGQQYGSLSSVAHKITGTRWNGWLFFGLKKQRAA